VTEIDKLPASTNTGSVLLMRYLFSYFGRSFVRGRCCRQRTLSVQKQCAVWVVDMADKVDLRVSFSVLKYI